MRLWAFSCIFVVYFFIPSHRILASNHDGELVCRIHTSEEEASANTDHLAIEELEDDDHDTEPRTSLCTKISGWLSYAKDQVCASCSRLRRTRLVAVRFMNTVESSSDSGKITCNVKWGWNGATRRLDSAPVVSYGLKSTCIEYSRTIDGGVDSKNFLLSSTNFGSRLVTFYVNDEGMFKCRVLLPTGQDPLLQMKCSSGLELTFKVP